MSSEEVDDMIKAASEGATKGFLDWTEEKLSDLARGFESRDLLFIEDRQTIDLVKEQRKKPEWELAFCTQSPASASKAL